MPPAGERRSAERVRPGPLRVRLHRLCQGILIDISELGALIRLPTEQVLEKPITLQLEWKDETVPLPARVVRSTPHRVQSRNAVLARTEYDVAVEFSAPSQYAVAALERIVREQSGQDS